MKTIETISGREGRAVIRRIFKELRYEKQMNGLSVLFTCWRLCTHERELFRYSSEEITVRHTLGTFAGTAVWLEEIVNRYYYSTINSFVYFGAAVLLVLIGVRRFSDNVSDGVVIGGIGFEALMLLMMFAVMLFSPNESEEESEEEQENSESIGELIIETGEISRDFAAISVQLEQSNEKIGRMLQNQSDLIASVSELVKSNAAAVSPNPEMLESMKETNAELKNFAELIAGLNEGLKNIRTENIEFEVKSQISKILSEKINNAKKTE